MLWWIFQTIRKLINTVLLWQLVGAQMKFTKFLIHGIFKIFSSDVHSNVTEQAKSTSLKKHNNNNGNDNNKKPPNNQLALEMHPIPTKNRDRKSNFYQPTFKPIAEEVYHSVSFEGKINKLNTPSIHPYDDLQAKISAPLYQDFTIEKITSRAPSPLHRK